MQAIKTTYLGPSLTNTLGSRIAATAQAGRKVYSWSHKLDPEDNHKEAANEYANALGWLDNGETLVGGVFKDDYYWVIVKGKV